MDIAKSINIGESIVFPVQTSNCCKTYKHSFSCLLRQVSQKNVCQKWFGGGGEEKIATRKCPTVSYCFWSRKSTTIINISNAAARLHHPPALPGTCTPLALYPIGCKADGMCLSAKRLCSGNWESIFFFSGEKKKDIEK